MAVSVEKIKARLKALFPKANLSTKRLDAYAAKLAPKPADDADDTAIDAIITDYNEVIDFEAVAKEDDKTRTLEADKKKAEEASAKAKGKKTDDEDNDDDDEDDPTDTKTDKLLKGLVKTIGTLKSDLENIKSGTVKQTKLQEAQSLLEKSEVFKGLDDETKKFMLKNVELDSETPFEEQIIGLETVFSKMVQGKADEGVYGGAAGAGNPSSTVNDKEIESIVGDM
jgi:hypothetical protein